MPSDLVPLFPAFLAAVATINPSVLVAAIAAVAALGGAWLTYRSSTRANDLSSRKVDLQEFREVKDRYRDMLAESDKQIERLRGELDRERERNGSLRHEVRRLQDQVDELERTVARHKLPPIE